MDEVQRYCRNCKRNVGAASFACHSSYCWSNIKACEVCNEPVHRRSIKAHKEEFHSSVKCKNCTASVIKREMPIHQEICPKRLVTCVFCEREVSYDNGRHIELCGSRTQRCELCSRYIMLKDKQFHLELHQRRENYFRGKGAGERHENMKKTSEQNSLENSIESCSKNSGRKCAYCGNLVDINISEQLHFLVCDAYKQKINDKKSESSIMSLKCKALEDYKRMFLAKEDCDVIFKVQQQELHAHRNILKFRSPVLVAAFQHDMKEKTTGIIEIEDCDPSHFSDFLYFLYCGEVENLTAGNVFRLFTLADKYNIQDLKTLCIDFIKNNLAVDTFCETISLALLHCDADLIKQGTEFFARNMKEIIVTVKWQSFILANPIQGNEILIKSLDAC